MNIIFKKQNKKENGFIALISSIIISAILLGVAVTFGVNSFHSRFNSLDSEFKRISLGLAESCVNVALLNLTEDYDYGKSSWDPDGEEVQVGDNHCVIKSLVHEDEDANHQKEVTILASGEFRGTFSTISTVAKLGNPSYSVIPPPTCSFNASPLSITQGNSTTLQWSIGGNANSFSIVRNIDGTNVTIHNSLTGSPLSDSPDESATYTATVSGPGGTSQCESPRSVIVQPPPSCADTVIMLDQRANHNRLGIYDAVKGLLDLYGALSPAPKIGIGSFGYPYSASGTASIPNSPSGHLTNVYGTSGTPGTGLYNTLYVLTSGHPNVAGLTTGMIAGVNVANAELLSITPSIPKVLIFISDGLHSETNTNILNSTDSAKTSGTQIFTIVIDQTNSGIANRSLMAYMSTGNDTPLPSSTYGTGHQNGSQNDAGVSTAQSAIDAENTDNDNFFIAPTFSQLPVLVQTIGEKVCPAATAPLPPPPTNNPPPPPPPPNIDLGSWEEI